MKTAIEYKQKFFGVYRTIKSKIFHLARLVLIMRHSTGEMKTFGFRETKFLPPGPKIFNLYGFLNNIDEFL